MKAAMRKVARALLALIAVVLVFEGLMNGLLNLALPPLINRRPERIRVVFDSAWMVIPGRVHVSGLQVRGQGVADQWLITAEDVTGRPTRRRPWTRRPSGRRPLLVLLFRVLQIRLSSTLTCSIRPRTTPGSSDWTTCAPMTCERSGSATCV